jgi:hypothetical protein
VRLDSNDYSVHPASIGRRVLVRADLQRVQAFSDGQLVADHERIWAVHQTISDPDHVQAAKVLRRKHITARPIPEPDVAIRCLDDYDTALGVDLDAGWPDGHQDHRSARDVSAEISLPDPALKAPTLRESAARLAEQAGAENWSHEEYLAACLQRGIGTRIPRR